MFPSYRPSDFLRCTLALAVVFGAGVAVAGAQTGVVAASPSEAPASAAPLNLQVPAIDTSSNSLFSSSSDGATDTTEVASLTHANPFVNAMQYGGRRYGRPRYRGGNTNQDGSSKYVFVIGGGLTQPVGNTLHYNTYSWGLQAGGGRQFNKNFALLAQFDYDNFGLTRSTLGNQQNLYNYYINLYNQQNGYTSSSQNYVQPISGLDGNAHVWSFSINPMYTVSAGEGLGAYIVGGVGFYHKVTNFTVPTVGTYCDYYYGCYQYAANQIIDHYTSNAPGFNGGFGLTYKLSRFSGERLFGEVRYVFVDNQKRNGVTVATASPSNANVANDYPANSNRTGYFPVKFGIRF